MGLLDSINTKNLKSTLATASKVVQKAEDALKTVASATSEIVAEKQAVARQKKETENAKKQREAEIVSGFYMEGDQLMVTTTEGMKKWLQDLGKDTTPALMQVLQTQMQVIKYVESPSMTGMLFDNMILCLNKALKLTSDPVQLENIRESFALMMQNYFFMIETNLRCAEKKNSEETTKLLIQSGEMLADAVEKVAQTIACANPATGATVVAKTAVMNVFEKPEAQSSYIKSVFSWLANKKVLKEKQELFYQTLEMLFETMDIHAGLLGPSILTHGMLRRYRHVLVDHYREIKIQQYIDRGYKIDAKKMEQLSAGLTSAATSLVNPLNTKGAIVGAVQSINAVGGLITDFVNSNKDKGLDINAYCDLQDALDAEYDRLKAEYDTLEQELNSLKEKQKEVGMFKFAEKKEWQEKIDRKKEEADVTYERMQITKNQSVNMRQTFPDSFAMRSDIDSYRKNLKRIEQKFAV